MHIALKFSNIERKLYELLSWYFSDYYDVSLYLLNLKG